MPQPRNDHSGDGDLDVGARLIEDEEIKALRFAMRRTRPYLLARVETTEFESELGLDRRIVARRQIGIVLQAQWRGAVEARFVAASASHETDGQELIQLGERAQHGNARIEMRAGPELDVFLPSFIQCAIATKLGIPRSLVTSSTQSRRPVSASRVCRSRM